MRGRGDFEGSRARVAALGLLAMFGLPTQVGCDRPCEGPGCEERYSGSLVVVHRGSERATGELDPLVAAASLEGSAAQGPDWAVALLPQRLLVGVPDLGFVYEESLASVAEQPAGETTTLNLLSPEGTILGTQAGSGLGTSLARLPDHDGDGVADLVIGAPGMRRADDSVDDGAVLIFSGLGDGLAGTWTPDDADLVVLGEEPGGGLGTVVAACADLDGDGLDDWAAAAPLAAGRIELAGRVVLGRSMDVRGADAVIEADALPTSWFGSDRGGRAGNSLTCERDLTWDGVPDLAVGIPFADDEGEGEAVGRVVILAGGAEMEPGGPSALLDEAADWAVVGSQPQEWLGWSVTAADLDGDGWSELVAGAPGWDSQTGRFKVWTRSGRPDQAVNLSATVHGEGSPDALGRTVLGADLDGDGIDDLLAGAPRYNPQLDGGDAGYDSGKLYLLPGDTERGWWSLDQPVLDIATTTWVRSQQYLRTGSRVAVGDFDEDGAVDLVLVHRTDPG